MVKLSVPSFAFLCNFILLIFLLAWSSTTSIVDALDHMPRTGNPPAAPDPKLDSSPFRFEDLPTTEHLTENEEASRSFSPAKTLVDAKLHLTMKLFQLKTATLTELAKSDKQLAQLILSDAEGDLEEIDTLQRASFYLPNKIQLNDICPIIEHFLRYKILVSVNLIQLNKVVIGLENNNDQLKSRIHLYIRHQYAIYQSFNEIYDDIMGYYKSSQNCKFIPYARTLNEFLSFLFTGDLKNETVGVKYFNKFIYKLAGKDFSHKINKIVNKYFELIIKTDDKFLIDFIEVICKKTCDRRLVVKLFLWLDGFPVGNASLKAINRLIKLYVSVANTGYLTDGSADVLLIHAIMKSQISDPEFKTVDNYLRSEFVANEKVVNDRAETLIRLFVEGGAKLTRSILNVGLRDTKYEKYDVWLYEIIVKSLLYVDPNNINNIYLFINNYIPKIKKKMYEKLVDILVDGKSIFSMEILKVAHHIKLQMGKEDSTLLKNRLPPQIRYLIWNEACKIKNVAYNDYLLLQTEPYFSNTEGFRSKKTFPYNALIQPVEYRPNSSSATKFTWNIMYDQIHNAFTIAENIQGSYLSVGKRLGDRTFRLHFPSKRHEKTATKWKIRIVKSDKELKNNLTFQLLDHSDPPGYLYAARNKLDGDTRSVLVSHSKKNSNDSFWKLICTDEEDKEKEEKDFQHKGDLSGSMLGVERFRIKEDDIVHERLYNLFWHEAAGDVMITFLEKIQFKLFLNVNEIQTYDDTKSEFVSSFIRNSYTFLHLQMLEIMDVSTYLNEADIIHERMFKDVIQQQRDTIPSLLSVYEYVLNNLTTDVGPDLQEFDSCEEAVVYIKKYKVYLQINGEISKIAASNQHLSTIKSIGNPSEFDVSHYYNYLQTENNCSNRLDDLNKNFDSYKFTSGIAKLLLINITIDAFLHGTFHVGAIYFRILNDESAIFQIFESLIGVYGSRNKSVYEYFIVFVAHLFRRQNLRRDTATKVLYDSYMKLNSLSHFNFSYSSSLRYSQIAKLIMRAGSYNTLSATARLNLEYILANEILHFVRLSEQLLDKDSNWEKQSLLKINQYYSRLGYYVFRQKNEKNIEQVRAFFGIFPLKVLPNVADDVIQPMLLSNNLMNKEAIKFAKFIEHYFDYIPCFHTGCVDDLDSILPGYSKKYVDNKICHLWENDYGKTLHISKYYFVNNNNYEKERASLKLEIRTDTEGSHDWVFEYVKENDTFFMKSRKENLYVTMGKRLGNPKNYKFTLVTNTYDNTPIEWKVELRKNSFVFSNVFTLRPVQVKTHLYLTGVDDNGGWRESGTVTISKLKSPKYAQDLDIYGHAEVWTFDCY